jgi:hypothetical protein
MWLFAFRTQALYVIIYSMMFLASFAVGQGELNWNVYIKQFAFGVAFAIMVAVSLCLPKRNKFISITWSDIFVLALFAEIGNCYEATL